jgi:hypothetical protein
LSKSSQGTAQAYAKNRRFPRHRLDVRIDGTVFRDGKTITLWGRTSELGPDGVGATLTEALLVGEVVSLEFPVPVPPHMIKMRAIVRYCRGLHCGFEFLAISNEQKQTLVRVCEVLESVF